MSASRLARATGRLARAGKVLIAPPGRSPFNTVPRDADPEFGPIYDRCQPFTLTSVDRMYALWQAVKHINRAEIPGDVVECGVWRGGSSMLAAMALMHLREERRMWLYDTFEGMTPPSEADVNIFGVAPSRDWAGIGQDDLIFAYASLEEVKANMATTGMPAEQVSYVKGDVGTTIPVVVPERIALLRLDTDWYESTRHELEHLWPRLQAGGVLIVDDYGEWAGARQAVDEYFSSRDDAPLLWRIDSTGRAAVKLVTHIRIGA